MDKQKGRIWNVEMFNKKRDEPKKILNCRDELSDRQINKQDIRYRYTKWKIDDFEISRLRVWEKGAADFFTTTTTFIIVCVAVLLGHQIECFVLLL